MYSSRRSSSESEPYAVRSVGGGTKSKDSSRATSAKCPYPWQHTAASNLASCAGVQATCVSFKYRSVMSLLNSTPEWGISERASLKLPFDKREEPDSSQDSIAVERISGRIIPFGLLP